MSRHRLTALILPGLLLAGGCSAAPPESGPLAAPALPTTPAAACLSDGSAALRASLRGAVSADLQWRDAQLSCEGGLRPDGSGLRVSLAGPLTGTDRAAPQQLRFVFGIDLPAGQTQGKALPTNVTLIIEGAAQLFATRGDDKCTIDQLLRTPLTDDSRGKASRIEARGFCTGPATSSDGTQRLLLATFEFTTRLIEE
jgi:hypothetical protein